MDSTVPRIPYKVSVFVFVVFIVRAVRFQLELIPRLENFYFSPFDPLVESPRRISTGSSFDLALTIQIL